MLIKQQFRYIFISLDGMYYFRFIYIYFFIGINLVVSAQDPARIDSLKSEIASFKTDDTLKVKKLISLSYYLSNYAFKDAIGYGNEALRVSQKLKYIYGEITAYNCMADAYWFHSDYDKSQQYYFKAYRINDSIHNEKGIAYSLYNIGWILCIQQHNYKEDKYLYKSLGIYEDLKDTSGLLKVYNALASYYSDRNRQTKKKQYFDSSMAYFNKGIELARKGGQYSEMGRIYGNLGDLFYGIEDYKSANFYNEKSMQIHMKSNDSSSMMISMLNMGLCELELGSVKSSISKFNYVYNYNIRHDIKDTRLLAIQALARAYYKLGNFKEAYDQIEKYVDLKETLDKETYSTSISNLQSSYSLEKSEANVEQLKQTNEIQELRNKKNTYFIFILLAVALIVIVAVVLLYRQNKQKQLTNIQLEAQHQIIAEKKQEIDNSIQYAKGIQQAILPDIKELHAVFEQSFVYYKPKDVVSGDFYWFSKVDDYFYCIAADCTGHGVPGALMSIIGIDKIVQAVYEKQITEPGKILSFLNTQIKQVLKQHSDASKQKDGMDIALLKFNNTLTEVEFSGANRPLYIIRNHELLEYKPNKTAIAGFTPDDMEFETTKISLLKQDALFVFTDGYADQFGGKEGKKFMSKNLKELLISISGLPATAQSQSIDNSFVEWKGAYEQVDDVLLMGIKI
ncbi:MAG: SpoIIE family protein phosphatase [Bacteroidota bacterium]